MVVVKENNDENSGPLTSLPVDRLTATDCNGDRSCQKKSVDEQIFNSSQSTLITSIICLFELGHANGFNGDIA